MKRQMPKYKLRAVTASGQVTTITYQSLSYAHLLDSLQREGLQLIYARRLFLDVPTWWHKRWTHNKSELIDFCKFAAAMDRSGISLLEILSDGQRVIRNRKMTQVLNEISTRIQEGATLSQALSYFPYVFEPIFIQMVQLGEKTGHLHQAFETIAEHLEWETSTKSQIYTVIRYPIFVTVTLLISLSAFSNFLIPELKIFLISTHASIAWYTSLLFYILENSTDVLWVILALLTIVVTLLTASRCLSKQQGLWLDRLALQTPLLGTYYTHIVYSHFFHCFASTFSSGIDLLQCLEFSANTVSNRYLANELSKVRLAIQEGSSLAKSFSKIPMCCISKKRLLYAGETTGQLLAFLLRIRDLHATQAKRTMNMLTSSLGPCLLFISGAFLLWIVMAIFQPIYVSLTTMEL